MVQIVLNLKRWSGKWGDLKSPWSSLIYDSHNSATPSWAREPGACGTFVCLFVFLLFYANKRLGKEVSLLWLLKNLYWKETWRQDFHTWDIHVILCISLLISKNKTCNNNNQKTKQTKQTKTTNLNKKIYKLDACGLHRKADLAKSYDVESRWGRLAQHCCHPVG